MTLKRSAPMKRSAPLKRGAPLKATTPLKSVKPLMRSSVPLSRAPMVQRRVKPAVTPKVRKSLAERSGRVCEIRSAAADCLGRASEASHRIKRGGGGRHGEACERNGRLSNLTHACTNCHRWIHSHPEAARAAGWMLNEDDDPLAKGLLYAGRGWCLLDDEGGWTPSAY